jgi:hypothetical protein
VTISSEIRKAGPFDGNGFTISFPFTFKVFAKTDIRVVRTDTAHHETTLTLDSDYSVTLNVDQDNNPGGTVTYPISGAPLASGYKLTLVGDIAYTQTADITNAGAFYPQVIENALDRSTIQIQQLKEQVERALTIAVSDEADTALPPAAANMLIGWNDDASALENVDPATLGGGGGASIASAVAFTPTGTVSSTNVQAAIAEVAAEAAAIPSASAVAFTPTGTVSSTNVQAAIAEVAAEAAAIPSASAVAFTPTGTVSSTNVQAAIAEVAAEAAAIPSASAVAFTPTGTISSTNVQAAIAEVAAEASGGSSAVANITALKALSSPTNGQIQSVSGYYAEGDGGGGEFVYNSSSTAADDGGLVIRPASLPASGRWIRSTEWEPLNVRWFGAKGDGVADDTTPIQTAINAGQANIRSIYFPSGLYICQPLTYPSTAYAAQISLLGANPQETIIRKKSGAATAPLLTIGSAAATNFTAGLRVENITFDGLSTSATTDAVKHYDLVRSKFESCTFKNANNTYYGLGGIYVTFHDCTFDSGNTGARFEKFTSLAGGGWPNGITFENSFLINNPTWGLWFDDGRLVTLDQCEVEGNGTAGNSTTGGIRIGANIGLEGGGATPNSIGLRARDTWCEANAGAASVVLLGGKNAIDSGYFVANPNATYDIYINGGYYHLEKCVADTSKSPNVFETASVSSGNWINACSFQNLSYNVAKTKIDYGTVAATPIYWAFYNNADYAATTGVDAVATLNSTYILSGGTHAGNTFQVNTAGAYRVSACIQIFGIGAGNYIYAQILKNGAIVHLGPVAYNSSGGVAGMRANVSVLILASTGDTIGMGYFCSGGAGPTVESDYVATYFHGEMI